MAISLRNKHLEELARHLAYERGESITDAILEALEMRLDQLATVPRLTRDLAIIENAAKRIAAMPMLSDRKTNDIIGYDKDGLPA